MILTFKTKYACYKTSKKIIDFLKKIQALENAHRLTLLGKERLYT